jgi:RNA polymerase sigma-70 factor (ECF subfamily)
MVIVTTGDLASCFASAHPEPDATRRAGEPLGAALRDFCDAGRQAWPNIPLEAETFATYLGARAPADVAPAVWLARLRAGDLFLACACAEGVPAAISAFEVALLGETNVYLRNLRPTPELVEETKQELRDKLFVGGPGRRPKIRQYSGEGALGGWVRVVALRTALNLLNSARAGRLGDDADEMVRAIVPTGDPELELLRASYRDAFADAFRAAIARLPRRERAALRFAFVEGLTPARIAQMYGVHRTTVMRWIEGAQARILAATRSLLAERLDISPSECDELIALVKSRIEITLGSLLGSSS